MNYNGLTKWHRDADGYVVASDLEGELYVTLTHEDGTPYTAAEEDMFILIRRQHEGAN